MASSAFEPENVARPATESLAKVILQNGYAPKNSTGVPKIDSTCRLDEVAVRGKDCAPNSVTISRCAPALRDLPTRGQRPTRIK